ncbi:MAG TPA: hypothetical protein VFC79_05250, partial [Tissierellaceae bacterium]|nr:hypothetical protein [Tissierellaceae bacterium]
MSNKLIGIISNEGELKGVVEDNSFNVIVQITESGAKGDKGDQGKDGYTPIKGVDYFDGEKGAPGTTAWGGITDKPTNLETVEGSQAKADAVLSNAKDYTDQEISSIDIPDSTWESIQNKPDTFAPSEHVHSIVNVTGLQNELNSKETPSGSQSKANVAESNAKDYVDGKVLTDVPLNAKFTDTVYSHPSTHPASMITDLPTGKKVARFV